MAVSVVLGKVAWVYFVYVHQQVVQRCNALYMLHTPTTIVCLFSAARQRADVHMFLLIADTGYCGYGIFKACLRKSKKVYRTQPNNNPRNRHCQDRLRPTLRPQPSSDNCPTTHNNIFRHTALPPPLLHLTRSPRPSSREPCQRP